MRSSKKGLLVVVVVAAAVFAAGVAFAAVVRHRRADRASARLAAAAVSVFPSPGARFAPPNTTIALRGISPSNIGTIAVSGSRSGAHTGTLRADSDGAGAAFIPDKPFTPGETVTVSTSLDLQGAGGGHYTFAVATPAGAIRAIPATPVARISGDVLHFHSRHDLRPAAVVLNRNSRRAEGEGDYFLASQEGPVSNGPAIYDPTGHLVFYQPMPKGIQASDFRAQRLNGAPVLTWWQGVLGPGIGRGVDVVVDAHGRRVATVKAANGLNADLHEFEITPRNTALIISYFPVIADTRSVGGSARAAVLDAVVQELDIPTGNVIFEWDALDHISLRESELPPPKPPFPYDPVHLNSAELDSDGNVVISARNTWTVYKVDHATGAVIWRLGGKRSSFKLNPGGVFAFQHDARVRAAGDRLVSLFDDSAGPPVIHRYSRAITLRLDFTHHTARVVEAFQRPPLLANFEGNQQKLADGDVLVGWGQQPYFTEFDARGRILAEGHTVGQNTIYRVYKFQWSETPTGSSPAVAARTRKSHTAVFMSWNGATTVARWRVLTGSSSTALTPVATVARTDFETGTLVPAAGYVEAQALDSAGKVLATSKIVRPR